MGDRAGSYVKTTVLLWADEISRYSLWNIMAFLSSVWKVNFTHAAAIVSVMGGSIKVMLIVMSFLVDTVLGNYGMLSLSSLSLSIGWSFLAISTSSIFFKMPYISCENGPLCVGELQWCLVYASLALIAMGIAGHSISLQEFLQEQLIIRSREDEEELQRIMPQIVAGGFMTSFVRFACIFLLPFVKPWGARFGIPATCMIGATFLFFRGSAGYICVALLGSPITCVFRVIVASCTKLWIPIPTDPQQLYGKYSHGNKELLPHTNRLRFLDKAAILSRSKTIEEQENKKWSLCTVTEVEETKIVFQMIPMWMSFVICGLILSLGNTYFLEQALNMSHRFRFITLSCLIFFWEFSKSMSTNIFLFVANMGSIFGVLKQKYIPAIGIAVGMFISILCCIVAAMVESMRLNAITMNVFWLIPQFILLGAMEGIGKDNILLFVVVQAPNSMKIPIGLLTEGVLGVGFIVSVLIVYVTGQVSVEKEGQSWFRETLNKSRLDKYYWALAGMSFINLLFYGLVVFLFDHKELPISTREEQQEQDVEMLHYHED